MIASCKHSSLFGLIIIDEGKKFYETGTWCLEISAAEEMGPASLVAGSASPTWTRPWA